MLEQGSIIGGKFRIERLLGRGGMGLVYAATHLGLGTQVALKFLTEQMLASSRVVERFMREARASAQLKSEHVCRVLDVDANDQMPFIVMELLEGTDLSRLVRKHGPLAPEIAADYVQQACAGLAEAHAAGIIHRDLKPGNLFRTIRRDGSPVIKVLDFGVAKSPEQDQDFSLTQTSTVIGSPGYMSPEQLRSSKGADARSDIWALGVILFELVAGKQPFKADSITDLALKIGMDPTPVLDGVPAAYLAVVNCCLEKSPDARYQDVGALAAALAGLVSQRNSSEAVGRLIGATGSTGVRDSRSSSPPSSMRPELVGVMGVTTVGTGPGNPAPPPMPASTSHHDAMPSGDPASMPSIPSIPAPVMTTLSGASGVLVRPAPHAPVERKIPWVPMIAGCTVAGVIIAFIVVGGRGGSGGNAKPVSASQPSHAAVVEQPSAPGPMVTPLAVSPPPMVTPTPLPPEPVEKAVEVVKPLEPVANQPAITKPAVVKPAVAATKPPVIAPKPTPPTKPTVETPTPNKPPADIGASRI